MKKIIILTFAITLIIPNLVFASWWNPLTWFIKQDQKIDRPTLLPADKVTDKKDWQKTLEVVSTSTPISLTTRFYIKYENSRLRSCPSIECDVLGYYALNQTVDISNVKTLNDVDEWTSVTTEGGLHGYFNKSVLSQKPVELTEPIVESEFQPNIQNQTQNTIKVQSPAEKTASQNNSTTIQTAEGRKNSIVKMYQSIVDLHTGLADLYTLDIKSMDGDLQVLNNLPNSSLVDLQKKLTQLRKDRVIKLYNAYLKIIDGHKHVLSVFQSKELVEFEKHNPDSFIKDTLSEEREKYENNLSLFEKDKNEYRRNFEKTKANISNSTQSQSQNSNSTNQTTSIGTPSIVIGGQFRSKLTNFVFSGRTSNDTTGVRSSCVFPSGDTISIANWMVGDDEIRAEVGAGFGTEAGTYVCYFSIDGTNIKSPSITIEVK